MSNDQPWTIGRLLEWTAKFLGEHESDSPRLDAEVLLAHARGCKRIELYTAYGDTADDSLRQKYRELVKQRSQGMPVAYLVGQREFFSLPFKVTPDVLIPRPETEYVLVAMLDRMKEASPAASAWRIADVGVGSGILAVCAAKHVANCEVTAIDISPAALDVARGNAASLGVSERVTFVQGDLLAGISPETKFDFILSNPPYVKESEYAELDRGVRDFEPKVALVGGQQGTEIIARLVPQAAERLAPGGWLIMELSPMIHDAVVALIAADGRFAAVETIKDLAKLKRVVAAKRLAP